MNPERIGLLFWLALCLFFFIESLRLGLGNIRAPGSGFFPFWTATMVGLMTVYLLFQEIMKKQVKELAPIFKGKNVRDIILVLVFLFAYGMLFEKIGFVLCTLLFMGCCLKVIGKKKWMTVMGLSLSVTVAAYMLFVVWLKIQYPTGRWIEKIIRF
jgi:putative tricarboxylic transport membrane protein